MEILVAFLIFSIGFLTGFKTRKIGLKILSDTMRTNIKAETASDYFMYDEGDTEDKIPTEEDNIDRKNRDTERVKETTFFS